MFFELRFVSVQTGIGIVFRFPLKLLDSFLKFNKSSLLKQIQIKKNQKFIRFNCRSLFCQKFIRLNAHLDPSIRHLNASS